MEKFSLLILAASLVGAAAAPQTTLEEICKGRPIVLGTVDAVKPVIELARSYAGSACSEEWIQSILDLEPIVASENVCSITVAKKIAAYYDKYVSASTGGLKMFRQLPKSIKTFFMAAASMVSKLCKESLMRRLEEIGNEGRISAQDSRVVLSFNRGAKLLAEAMTEGDQVQTQSLFLVAGTDSSIRWRPRTIYDFGRKKIVLDLVTKRLYDEVRHRCQKKVKPIYDKLISPLVILSNVGFDYDQGKLGHEFRAFTSGALYRNWLQSVYICEITLVQDVIANPRFENIYGGMILHRELDKKGLEELEQKTNVQFEPPEPLWPRSQPIEYPLKVQLDGSLDLASNELREDMNNFSSRRSGAKSLRKKQVENFFKAARRIENSTGLRLGLAEESKKSFLAI